jgi:2-oxoglutarate dehydrogenase E1 component
MDSSYTYEQLFLADQFETYLRTHKSSSDELSAFFDGFLLSLGQGSDLGMQEAMKMLQMYRHFGYLKAKTNPLNGAIQAKDNLLTPSISLDTLVPTFGLLEAEKAPLSEFIAVLDSFYAQSIGYEFLHCEKNIYQFLIESIERKKEYKPRLEELEIYKLLTSSEFFETFLHTRFPGQKRFSLEGLETSAVLIEEMLFHAADKNYQSAFFGMAHRGRLNLLANLFNKPLSDIFLEFSKDYEKKDSDSSGDVKYHQGAVYKNNRGLNLTLCSNPSHLEAVDPVVQGMCYAQQKISKEKALTFMIHGDASFAGQGVVYETMQLSKIKGFDTGGIIHLILNNQIGFTALPHESRSTKQCSDLAKCFNCPIFHVNAEDVEAVTFVAKLAIELVSRFSCDVMIDLIGYRKWGHNESDEPFFTQPLLYEKIKNKKTPLSIYKQVLVSKDAGLENALEEIEKKAQEKMQSHFNKPLSPSQTHSNFSSVEPLKPNLDTLITVGKNFTTIPSSFNIHPKLQKLFNERHRALEEKKEIDFALAELLAIGYILETGKNIRFVGQDSARGTFSQRHALLVDQKTEKNYLIFTPLLKESTSCEIINSPLSEFAVLGFEYGFSKIAKNSLNIWEAQFGDFANSAQVIIDQFIASGRSKWHDQSNLTLLLPHGYEGQGPEHTSARIERFLELSAQNNMKILVPSTPKQYFALLIAQLTSFIPAVVFTPKALLRLPECKSQLQELEGSFEPIIDDNNQNASIIVFCYGKIYYDLIKLKKPHVSLIRLEQLYPLNHDHLEKAFKARNKLKKTVLVQDEPLNMGAYTYLKAMLKDLEVISRKAASSPATGFYHRHQKEYQEILTQFENL